MGKIAGRIGRLAVSSDGGTTFETVGGVQDMSMTGNADELDVSAHDTGQFREYIQGRKDASIDGSMWWDESDVGQEIIKNAYFSATRIDVRFRMEEGVGLDEITAKGIVTTMSPTSPNDDAAAWDFTLRLRGDFTFSKQT